MQKLKSVVFVAGVMLLILAAAMGYLYIKFLPKILERVLCKHEFLIKQEKGRLKH